MQPASTTPSLPATPVGDTIIPLVSLTGHSFPPCPLPIHSPALQYSTTLSSLRHQYRLHHLPSIFPYWTLIPFLPSFSLPHARLTVLHSPVGITILTRVSLTGHSFPSCPFPLPIHSPACLYYTLLPATPVGISILPRVSLPSGHSFPSCPLPLPIHSPALQYYPPLPATPELDFPYWTLIPFLPPPSSHSLASLTVLHSCAADFSLLNLPKGKSLGRSKPATYS